MPLRDCLDSADIQAKQAIRVILGRKAIQDSADIQDSAARQGRPHHLVILDIQVKADGQG